MSDYAVQVDELGKYYRLGMVDEEKESLVAGAIDILRSPIKNYRKYRSLYDFSDIGDGALPANVLVALQDISFNIEPGERVGLIGANGAGKSTLLKVVSRITPPSRGRVLVRGRLSSLLEVGTGFHPELTGRENVYLNGTVLGMSRGEIRRKYDEIVAFAGVERFLDTPVKRYSSGMRVRLAFAVAAHLEPDIMVIDEVLAVGDAAFQQKCLSVMEQVGHDGRTVIFVSHNMGMINQLCDRAIWLESGRIVMDGPAQDVVGSYLSSGSTGNASWTNEVQLDTNVVIRGVRLFDESSGELGASLNADGSGIVEIAYEVLRTSANYSLFIRLFDSQGNNIFTSRDTDNPDWRGRARQEGNYRSSCKLPGFLKPGRYHLSVGVSEGARVHDRFDRVLMFDVNELGCDINPKRIGLILPVLEWKVEPVQQSEAPVRAVTSG